MGDVEVDRPLRVLMIEDVAEEAELAIRLLKTGGVQFVHEVVDAELPFRSALTTFRPDIILSDFTLPSFDGLAALDIAVVETPHIPFVFLSGTIGEERAIEVLRRGAVDYVLKTNPARLASVVKRAVRESVERRRRRRAEKRIRENEQRLRDIIDTSQDWIWELNAEGRYVFSSRSVEGILGYSAKELGATPCAYYLHPDDRDKFAAVLTSMDSQHVVMGTVSRWRHRDGEYRWLEGNLTSLVVNGKVVGFRGSHRDITERKQQQERLSRLTRVLQMQSGINAAVVRIRDRDGLLREACRLATEVAGFDSAAIFLLDSDGHHVRPTFQAGEPSEDPDPTVLMIGDGTERDASLITRAIRTGEVIVCNDLTNSEPPVAMRHRLIALGYTSIVALPLIVDGARIGALSLGSREPRLAHDEELLLLQDITANISLALEFLLKEDTVQYLAYYDPLTGLAKRALFCERLDGIITRSRAGGPGTAPTVVAFDVQHLSNVNDSFGHHVGDLLLQQVAQRLKHHVENDEHIGYLGSGTFVLVVPQLGTSEESVTAFLGSTVFSDVFTIEGRSIRISYKSGIAHAPGDGEEGSMLVQKADAALKHAKESGEQYLHYQLQMHSEIAERLALEHRLRVALDEQQFVVFYQPQVDITTGQIRSVEALLRWNDPEEGIVEPSRFLFMLESSAMIVPVGEWVLRKAAEDCQRWRSLGLGPMRVAVNVASLQIRRRSFVEHVLNAASGWSDEDYGIDIEITETGLLQDLEATSRKLRELREAGVRVAIDDFGTGYSSLGLLSQLPVDQLKIDRSFISGLPDDRASVTLVSSVIGLAMAFNLTAVAEGVETEGQLQILRALKCHQSQGYLHCRPVPIDQLEVVLQKQAAARVRR